MPDTSLTPALAPLPATALTQKLLNLFASPAEVFDEIVAAPAQGANWRIPTLLVCLVGIISLRLLPAGGPPAPAIGQLANAGTISTVQAEMLAGARPLASALAVCFAAVVGTLWSAFVLWIIGRVFLKARLSFNKTLEVTGLTAIILVLGTIVTGLLIAASGDPAARPSLSLLALKLDPGHTVRRILDVLNVFHLWSTALLALGLSRLTGVTFKEAAFWVFGYWLLARIVLIILA